MFRHAEYKDKDELKALWHLCFEDSEAFTDWFFSERFVPHCGAVWEEGGRIVCAAHALPVHVRMRGAILPAALIAGVATLPEFRGRGIMRAMLTEQMRHLRRLGIPLVVHRPVNIDVYRSLCHYAVADKSFLALPGSAPRPKLPAGTSARLLDPASSLDALYFLYARAAGRYGGTLVRSYADFALKYRDYAADGVKCAAAYRDGELVGYAFFSESEEGAEAPEVLAFDGRAYMALVGCIADAAEGRDMTLFLPPDALTDADVPEGATLSTVPRTVAGVTDVRALLRVTGAKGFALEVADPVLPENSGIYDICGEPASAPARLKLDPGRLAQLVFGYRSASELTAEGLVAPLDADAAAALDALLPPKSCYFVDEY